MHGLKVNEELAQELGRRAYYVMMAPCAHPSLGELLLVFVVAFGTFLNSLGGGFVFDDNQAIVHNADVVGGSPLSAVFQNDFWGSPMSHPGSHRSYRPLTILSFRLNHFFGQLNPVGYHLANVLLHAVVSCLVLKLATRFCDTRGSRLFCALLFAVHPIHCESVANLVGRADLFAAFFSLLAFLLHEHLQKELPTVLLSLIGLGFKETAIAALPLVAARALSASERRKCARLIAWTGTLALLRLWLNGFKSPEFSVADNPIAHHPSPLLCFDWSMDAIPPITSLLDHRLWTTIALYSAATVSLYKLVSPSRAPPSPPSRKRKRSPSPRYDLNANLIPSSGRSSPAPQEEPVDYRISLAVSFLVLPFLPASNLFAYVGFVVAERVLYLPSVGFCLIVGMLYERSGPYKKAAFVVLLLLAARSLDRNRDWNDEERLYRSAVEINPAKAYSNLGNILSQKKRPSEAMEAYAKALEHRPGMADTHYNLGVLHMEQKNLAGAIGSYQRAIQLRPSFASAYLNLGICLWNAERVQEAETVFRECGRVDGSKLKNLRVVESAKTGCRYNLGRLLVGRGRVEEAVEAFQEAVRQMPEWYEGHASLLNMLGEALLKKGRAEEAEKWYKKAMEASGTHVPAYLTLANLRMQQKNYEEAETLLHQALALNPRNPETLLHLGRLLSLQDHWEAARDSFESVLNLHPNHPDALFGAANAYRQLGRPKKSEELYKALVVARPDATSLSNYGAILHLNEKYDEAEKVYRRALELKPEDEVTATNLKKLRRAMRK
uniref:dolichyl-phosphate-mannose--protein mannosyltransferase n=1 Tax=Steinernema glaseri TaxID=37863 RepID=A0A1I7YTP2_9BILA